MDIIQNEIISQTVTSIPANPFNNSSFVDKLKSKGQELYGGLVTWGKESELDDNIGVYFDVITDHSITITNDITDNYTENNTAIHDVIAHAPIECSLNGMVGELVYVPSTSNPRFLKRLYNALNEKIDLKKIGADKINGNYRDYVVTDKLSAIGQLLPPVDNLTQLAKNVAVDIEESINRYTKIFKNVKRNINDVTKLQNVYNTLVALRDTDTALTFTSPFGVLYRMYITNLEFNQGNENHVATISISMKQVNFTDIQYTKADPDVLAKYNSYTQADVEDNGKAEGKDNKTALQKTIKADEVFGTSGVRQKG